MTIFLLQICTRLMSWKLVKCGIFEILYSKALQVFRQRQLLQAR